METTNVSNTLLEDLTKQYYSVVQDNPNSITRDMIQKEYLSKLKNPVDQQKLLLLIRKDIDNEKLNIKHSQVTDLEKITLNSIEEVIGTDALTKLANRTQYDYDIPGLINQYDRENNGLKNPKTYLSLLFIDINDFGDETNNKYPNDGGHAFGDDVLKYLADAIKKYTRKEDNQYRLGGDEFLIIQKIKSKEKNNFQRHIKDLTKKINNYVQEQIAQREDGKKANISLSIGVGFYKEDGNTIEKVIEIADNKMYKMKNTLKLKREKTSINDYNAPSKEEIIAA